MTSKTWIRPLFRAMARFQIARQVKDPELRRKVTPTDEVGCKRVMLTDDWYPTLAEPNVELITERIAEVTPRGVRTVEVRREAADAFDPRAARGASRNGVAHRLHELVRG